VILDSKDALHRLSPFSPGSCHHSEPRTTKLYDTRKDLAILGEIETRIALK
jgi:hypothetical protein